MTKEEQEKYDKEAEEAYKKDAKAAFKKYGLPCICGHYGCAIHLGGKE